MSIEERPVVFECEGEQLIGIVTAGETSKRVGMVVVVGGPQYRAGGHRQFVLLGRHLAKAGIPVLRYDYRGMGDSSGSERTFEHIEKDIASGIDALKAACPDVDRVVLLGLCDAASACLMYGPRDSRVGGIVMLNPWVFSEETYARSQIKYHYVRRVFQREFWAKLVRGRVDFIDALRVLARAGRPAADTPPDRPKYQDAMAAGLKAFEHPVLVVLSGRDPTAQAFLEYCGGNPRWHGLIDRPNVQREMLANADHTFAAAELRSQVERTIAEWLERAFPQRSGGVR